MLWFCHVSASTSDQCAVLMSITYPPLRPPMLLLTLICCTVGDWTTGWMAGCVAAGGTESGSALGIGWTALTLTFLVEANVLRASVLVSMSLRHTVLSSVCLLLPLSMSCLME